MPAKVVITGMGVVSPVGNSVPAYWEALCAGRSGVRKVPFFSENIASQIAGMCEDVAPDGLGAKDLRRQSRYILFALDAADQAWRQAGLDIGREDPWRCGAVIGTGIGSVEDIHDNVLQHDKAGPRRVSPLMLPKALGNMAAGAVAIRLGLQGPNFAVATACASGTQAIGGAVDQIRAGKAEVMLAGGSEATIFPFGLAGFCAMRALSTRNDAPEAASRPFDADRDGFVMGEGAAVLVLESEEHARRRGADILAEVGGVGETCDAYHVVAPRPDGSGPAAAMSFALRYSGVNPRDVDYINAHGTSTQLNDPSETRAIRYVFGDNCPPVSSTKSMIGHLLGAAGAVEAVACVMTIRTGVIHPNINYDTPDPECDLPVVANAAREQKVAIAVSNSLGFGGHNASVVFKRYE